MSAGRDTEARQLLSGDAPVGGNNHLMTCVLARCTHATSLLHSSTANALASEAETSHKGRKIKLLIADRDIRVIDPKTASYYAN